MFYVNPGWSEYKMRCHTDVKYSLNCLVLKFVKHYKNSLGDQILSYWRLAVSNTGVLAFGRVQHFRIDMWPYQTPPY